MYIDTVFLLDFVSREDFEYLGLMVVDERNLISTSLATCLSNLCKLIISTFQKS